MGRAFRRLVAATLGNTRHFDAVLRAPGHIPLAVEAAIGAIPFGSTTEAVPVALQGCGHMVLVGGVPLQDLILRDQAMRAFRQEHLVAELDGLAHLAAFDEIGVGFED
jgi:hypothetical protein